MITGSLPRDTRFLTCRNAEGPALYSPARAVYRISNAIARIFLTKS